jgi:hypothetical protein
MLHAEVHFLPTRKISPQSCNGGLVQRRDVRVKFFSYANTMQSNCIRLMGRKVLVSMMMEGKFSGEGLAGIEEDTDMMSAMARELVEQGGVGETADDVWRQVNQQRHAQFGSAQSAPVLPADVVKVPADEELPLVAAMAVPEGPSVVVASTASAQPSFIGFAMAAIAKRKRKSPERIDSGQLPLFAA